MKDRPTGRWMQALALLFLGAGRLPCVAQRPASTAPAQPSTASAATSAADGLPSALPDSQPPIPDAGSRVPLTPGPSPLAAHPTLKPAPFAPSDLRFPINLATALRLSDARPLVVAAAQARTWVAEAELTRAKVIWIPVL